MNASTVGKYNTSTNSIAPRLLQPCKLWIQNQCENSEASCVYVHSFFCPESDFCNKESCTLLHHAINGSNLIGPKKCVQDPGLNINFCQGDANLNDLEVITLEDDGSLSPSPTFDDELCKELEEIGEELDNYAKEAVNNNVEGNDSDSGNAFTNYEFLSSPSAHKRILNCEEHVDSKSMQEDFPITRVKMKMLLQQKSQLIKRARFLVGQRKILSSERDNVMKKLLGGTKNQQKIQDVLHENSRLTKELSVFLQNITSKIHDINDIIEGIRREAQVEGPAIPVIKAGKRKDQAGTPETANINCHQQEANANRGHLGLDSLQNMMSDGWETSEINESSHEGRKNRCFEGETDKKGKARDKKCEDVFCETPKSLMQADLEASLKGKETSSDSKSNPADKTIGSNKEFSKGERKPQLFAEVYDMDNPNGTPKIGKKTSKSPRDKNTYWCKLCNVFFTSVFGYVEHLESMTHIENMKNYRSLKSVPGSVAITDERRAEDVLPLGVEFLHSTTIFFCKLCNEFFHNKDEASLHPVKPQHQDNYKIYIKNDLAKEINFMEEKMVALKEYCKERQKKNIDRTSDPKQTISGET